MTNAHLTEKNTELWKMRLALNQQMLFDGLKKLATQSKDQTLIATTNRQWFSGLDYALTRMLPDGAQTLGAPTDADLRLRHAIVADVLDGLKSRPRIGFEQPCSLYVLSMEQYQLALAMCQLYQQIEKFQKADTLDPYAASSCETTVYTLLHVVDAPEPDTLYKPLDETDLDACIL